MIDNNLRNLSCKSRTYYQSVTSIEVRPVDVYHTQHKLLYKKGDTIVKKRLFRSPLYRTAETDLYDYYGELLSPMELAAHVCGIRYSEEKNSFFVPARVKICKASGDNYVYFDTDDEMKVFVSDFKEKCKKCGNELL